MTSGVLENEHHSAGHRAVKNEIAERLEVVDGERDWGGEEGVGGEVIFFSMKNCTFATKFSWKNVF